MVDICIGIKCSGIGWQDRNEGKGSKNASAVCVVQVSAQYFSKVNYVRKENVIYLRKI